MVLKSWVLVLIVITSWETMLDAWDDEEKGQRSKVMAKRYDDEERGHSKRGGGDEESIT